jgi:Peptidase family M28
VFHLANKNNKNIQMKTLIKNILILGTIALIIFATLYFSIPQEYSRNKDLSEYSTERALKHIKEISKQPHYVGSPNHAVLLKYLDQSLQKMGLETQIQDTIILSKWANLVPCKNLITRIKGSENGKALLLLTHYDSAPHSKSYGASDDANGLGVILEGVRTFLQNKTKHKNDIIIVFSDAEEQGLNGAYAFSKFHPWIKNTGIVINFEARGTKGASMMLAESNTGNANLIKAFDQANVQFPVSNSLMYSIYKMLPNDTDMTAFRETANVPGYTFAYIDDHFDYHSIQDNYKNVTPNSVEHQAQYLIPILNHFSNINLNEMNAKEDYVYFNLPQFFVKYPFSYNLPLWIGALFLFGIILFFGLNVLNIKEIVKGFIPALLSIVVSGLVSFGIWQLILKIYPVYHDMLHGFTYNGKDYMFAFLFLTFFISFLFYSIFAKEKNTNDVIVAPIFLWLIITCIIIFKLPGAGFFIIPVYIALISWALFMFFKVKNLIVHLFVLLPIILIMSPFVELFPIGLGLKMLAGSSVFVVLIYILMLTIFLQMKNRMVISVLFLILSIGFFVKAHFNNYFEKERAKPNSLLYVYNADAKVNFWATYDKVLDHWNKPFFKNDTISKEVSNLSIGSKYNSSFTNTQKAPLDTLAVPSFTFLKDTLVNDFQYFEIEINPNRKVNRIQLFADEKIDFYNFTANGHRKINEKNSLFVRKNKSIINYYPVDDRKFIISFQLKKGVPLDIDVMTASFDLLENPKYKIPKRTDDLMPKPFVLTDAIVVKKKLRKI